jgi:hypothetical protein
MHPFKGVVPSNYGSGRRQRQRQRQREQRNPAALHLEACSMAHGPGHALGTALLLLAHGDTSEHDFAVRYDIRATCRPGSHWGASI